MKLAIYDCRFNLLRKTIGNRKSPIKMGDLWLEQKETWVGKI